LSESSGTPVLDALCEHVMTYSGDILRCGDEIPKRRFVIQQTVTESSRHRLFEYLVEEPGNNDAARLLFDGPCNGNLETVVVAMAAGIRAFPENAFVLFQGKGGL
jgi:hypothetical protein